MILKIEARVRPPLDAGFVPAVLWNRAYREIVRKDSRARPLALVLKRPDGTRTRFDFDVLPNEGEAASLNLRYIERILKFLLWSRGASRVFVGGDTELAAALATIYSEKGERQFDAAFFSRIYGSPLVIEAGTYEEAETGVETASPLGRHLDGCRIGFDLGGSDRKCAAVIDGKVVFSDEVAWDPYFQSDPRYHYEGIMDSLKRAAAHLPRVDAIGGSAAGVYVGNEVRAGSLFRGIEPVMFEEHVRRIFFQLQDEWGGVPFEVANDGDVTALAASMAFGENRVLGISMGTSVAAGYVTANGNITPWLNELAFAPVDYRDAAPRDEWSGDLGCAVQYFCQQGVARLAPGAGLRFPPGMKFAEQLVEVQNAIAAGDPRAARIYETIGVCFGYAIAQFAEFYDIGTLLILGRVTSGEGGNIILNRATEVLQSEFPALADSIRLRTPDEKDKRHGQAVAAASLPALRASNVAGSTGEMAEKGIHR